MKRLADLQLLSGETEEITLGEFREHPGEVVIQVRMGKTFVITSHGLRVALLSPYEPSALELGSEIRRRKLA